MPDLNLREMVVILPLAALVLFIGLHPGPLLSVMHLSVDHLLNQVNAAMPLRMAEVFIGP